MIKQACNNVLSPLTHTAQISIPIAHQSISEQSPTSGITTAFMSPRSPSVSVVVSSIAQRLTALMSTNHPSAWGPKSNLPPPKSPEPEKSRQDTPRLISPSEPTGEVEVKSHEETVSLSIGGNSGKWFASSEASKQASMTVNLPRTNPTQPIPKNNQTSHLIHPSPQ